MFKCKYYLFSQSEPQYDRKQPTSAVEICCRAMSVPENCMGMCMGGCKEIFGGILPKSACHKYEKIAGDCCEDWGHFDY